MKILVTCPPMLGMIDRFAPIFAARGLTFDAPEVTQTLSEAELVKTLGEYDGWIIGDDPANRTVLSAGMEGRLKAAVKWGVGTDNVDFEAARDLGLPITNTPRMFGEEVADVALGYAIGLARQLFEIDRAVRDGGWPKPRGISLSGKRAGVVGFGDIGRALSRRLLALGMYVDVYDPGYVADPDIVDVNPLLWPLGLENLDFVFLVCALTKDNHHMVSGSELARMKSGVRIVNVSRGPLINEAALVEALRADHVHSVALDVFETEPLPKGSRLRDFDGRVLFGSHNASNTEDAVIRASRVAIDALCGFLGIPCDDEETA